MHGSSWDRGRSMKTFVSTLLATLLTNHKNYRDTCLGVHRRVCWDKTSSIAVKSSKYKREITLRPVGNSFLLYTSWSSYVTIIIRIFGVALLEILLICCNLITGETGRIGIRIVDLLLFYNRGDRASKHHYCRYVLIL